jgi:hypothetical protein
MAELVGSSAIVPASGEYTLNIKDFNADGTTERLAVPLPKDEKWGNVLLRAALLKRTTWRNNDLPSIIHAVVYADQLGLDIMAGDVYQAEGQRLSTTAGAKIKHGMATGRIVGYTVEITDGPVLEFPWKTKNESGVEKFPNYQIKVTVQVRDWEKPVVYEATLKEWFVGANPNWRTRPKYMLRLNSLGKAFQEVAPMGVEADEAPPMAESFAVTEASDKALGKGGAE